MAKTKKELKNKFVIMHPNKKFDKADAPCFIDSNGKNWVPFNKCAILKKDTAAKIQKIITNGLKINNSIVASADVISMQYTDLLLKSSTSIKPINILEKNESSPLNLAVKPKLIIENVEQNEQSSKNDCKGKDEPSQQVAVIESEQVEQNMNDKPNTQDTLKKLQLNGEKAERIFKDLKQASDIVCNIRNKVDMYKTVAENIYDQENSLMQDYLHFIELTDEIDDDCKIKLVDEMKASRIRRRHADDSIKMAIVFQELLEFKGSDDYFAKFDKTIKFDERNYHNRVMSVSEMANCE